MLPPLAAAARLMVPPGHTGVGVEVAGGLHTHTCTSASERILVSLNCTWTYLAGALMVKVVC